MPRFVLTARADIVRPRDLDQISTMEGVILIDQINNRAALVEAPATLLEKMRECLPGWLIEEERLHPRPDLRHKM